MKMLPKVKNIKMLTAINSAQVTVTSLAKETGFSNVTISRILNNRVMPARGTAEAIAKALNVKVEHLFESVYDNNSGKEVEL